MDIRYKERYIERLEAQLVEAHRRLMNDKDTCNPWRDIPMWMMHVAHEKGWQEYASVTDPRMDYATSYMNWLNYRDQVMKLT